MTEMNWKKVSEELLEESTRYLKKARTVSIENPFYPMLMTASYITYSISRAIHEGAE